MLLESLTDIDAKVAKISVIKWASSLHKIVSKMFCFMGMPGREKFGHYVRNKLEYIERKPSAYPKI